MGTQSQSCIVRRGRHIAASLAFLLATAPAAWAAAPVALATIAAGQGNTCGVTPAGTVKCWGGSFEGQVGDGTQFERRTPVDVAGLAAITAVTTGASHVCALGNVGTARCWGSNMEGQLGDGSLVDRHAPVPVSGLGGPVAALSAGGRHTCARLAGGGVQCWGYGFFGALGNGSDQRQPLPTTVPLLTGVVDIAAGGNHTCAVTGAGAVKCWGSNGDGQVGIGVISADRPTEPSPVDVVGLGTPVTAVAAGVSHTCALTTAGGVKCWGLNVVGQLGDGTTTPRRPAPVDVVGLSSGVVAISAGGSMTCALMASGSVKCWGQGIGLGIGETDNAVLVTAPVDVPALGSGVLAIGAGSGHACAVVAGGEGRCWGRNDFGKLGNDSYLESFLPVALVPRDVVPAFNTGVDANGSPLAPGSVDPHYTLAASADPAFPGPNAVVATAFTSPFWVPNSAASQWIAPSPVQDEPTSGPCNLGGTYTYRTTIDLTGFDPATVSIAVRWAADDTTPNFRFNGTDFVVTSFGPSSFRFFRLPSGYVAGVNTLDFVTTSAACPNGLRVELSATGSPPAAPDTVPDAFAFAAQADVPVGTTRTSAAVVPAGYNATAPVSVSGGEYSVGCGAAFTALAGTIDPGQSVCVRHVSSALAATAVTTTLTVGGVSATFTSTTAAAAPPGELAWSASAHDFGAQSMRTTSPAAAFTLSNATGAAVTPTAVTVSTHFVVSHDCGALAAGASCSALVRLRPEAEGALAGTLTATFAGGTRTVSLAGLGELSLTTHYYRSILRRAPDLPGKAFWEAEKARLLALGADLNETWLAMAGAFFTSAEYLAFARGDAGFVTDLYRTFFDRDPDAGGQAFWTGQLAQGMPREVALASFMFSAEFDGFTRALFGDTAVRAEVGMVVDFYRGLLARLPEDAGFGFWRQRLRTAQCAGAAEVTAQAEAISSAFAISAEYAARARNDSQYVGDLYNAFLRRGGDLAGVQFWLGALGSGTYTREQLRRAFVASAEFQARVADVIAAGCLP